MKHISFLRTIRNAPFGCVVVFATVMLFAAPGFAQQDPDREVGVLSPAEDPFDPDKLDPLPKGPLDLVLYPNSPAAPQHVRSAETKTSASAKSSVMPGRTVQFRDPSNKFAFTYSMSSDATAYRLVNVSVSTQSAGKPNTIGKVITIDELSDQPARYTAERVVGVNPNTKSIIDTVVSVAGLVIEVLGKVCAATEDFVKVLAKYRDHAPAWLQPAIDELTSHAPPSWTGKEVAKLLMPGGSHPLTQRFIAEIVRVYGKDYTARDRALMEVAATHLVVTGQAKDSPKVPYTAEKALALEHSIGMANTLDVRWAQALANAINAQYR